MNCRGVALALVRLAHVRGDAHRDIGRFASSAAERRRHEKSTPAAYRFPLETLIEPNLAPHGDLEDVVSELRQKLGEAPPPLAR